MKALLQRVTNASVHLAGEKVGSIGKGLAVFVAVIDGDNEEDARYLVEKILHLRIFSGGDDRFDLSLKDVEGEALIVSEFTLAADTRKGRRPSFTMAALPHKAEPLFNYLVDLFKASGLRIATGRFGAHMLVSLENDGPVTILIDSQERLRPRRQGPST